MAQKAICYGAHDRAGYLRSEYLVRSRADAERAAKLEWGNEPMRLERYPTSTYGLSEADALIRSYNLTTNEGWAAL